MNIKKESTGDYTATITIGIGPEDYNEAVEKQIQDHKRKANIPGFRPGHVPAGLIKKMYGKAILADEINKLLSDSLHGYIKDEKLDILGNPIPSLKQDTQVDFENQTDFEFCFDLGLSPAFDLQFNKEVEMEYPVIRVDDTMIDKYIEDTRNRFGKPAPGNAEQPEAEIQPSSGEETATPKTEKTMIPAEMTPEFFNQVYPGKDIKTEEDFREQVKKDAESSFVAETDKLFFNKVTEMLVKNTAIPLPDDFLKRWLVENNEGKYTPEEIEKNYASFTESMKWQLIENKLIRENQIEVTDQDIRQYIKTFFLRQVVPGTPDPEMESRYEGIVDRFMENKEQVQRINDQLYNARLLELFKQTLTIINKEVSFDEYLRLANESHHHPDDPGDDHNHDPEHDAENAGTGQQTGE